MENSLKLEYCKNYNNWCEKEKRTCKNCYYERGYNMTDKEKRAIEYLKSRLYGNEDCKFIDVAQSDLRIFLNLIETQQKEIEELKDEYNIKLLSNAGIYQLGFNDGIKSVEDKIKAKIEEFKRVRDEILREEKEFNRPMMTYDLKRNDYCEKMLQSLLNEEE